jgi:hypothetical protein
MSIRLGTTLDEMKVVFDVLKDVVQDVNLSFTKDRLEIHTTDPEKMSVILITFDHPNLYVNEFEETVHVGVYAPFLYKTLRTGRKTDNVEFIVNGGPVEGEYNLTVNVIGSGFIRTTTTIPSIMMPVENFTMGSTGTLVGVDARNLWMACRDLSAINKLATLNTPSLTLTADHPMGKFKSDLTPFLTDPVPVMMNNSATFHVKMLMKLCKMRMVDTITLNVSQIHPIMIQFPHRVGMVHAHIATVNDYLPDTF